MTTTTSVNDQNASVGWNSSTMCLQTLHVSMLARGWNSGDRPEIPTCDYEFDGEQLPRRPLDLGVGLWR